MSVFLAPGTTQHAVYVALSEAGYPGYVRPPKPWHPPAAKFAIPRSTVPIEVTHKALMLHLLSRRGADFPARCATHARATDVELCPHYPVGALLAGTIRGCDPANQP